MNEPKPHLALTPAEHAVAKMLKERHGIKWPFAAIIAKDAIALRVVDGSLSMALDPTIPPIRHRKKQRLNVASDRDEALEDFRNSPPILEA